MAFMCMCIKMLIFVLNREMQLTELHGICRASLGLKHLLQNMEMGQTCSSHQHLL